MIACLVVIGCAFTWMLYESDWLRIRMVVGAIYRQCDGCGANHNTPTSKRSVLMLGGEWREYHVCPECLESIEHRPNKHFEEATRYVVPAWHVAKSVENSAQCTPMFDTHAIKKWMDYVTGPKFVKKYKDWPQTFVLYIDGKKRVDWHSDDWRVSPPKNFGKAYKAKKIKVSK